MSTGDEATLPSFGAGTWGLRLPTHRRKRSLQLGICNGDAMGNTLHIANKVPICQSFTCYIKEGDEATSLSFGPETWGLRLLAHS